MLARARHARIVKRLLAENRVVAILGARQVGKSTLARGIAASQKAEASYFDLENEEDVRLLADPLLALGKRSGLVVLDEVQRIPEIFRSLRVLADRPRGARFLVLGSATPALLRQSSESLAGRIAYHVLAPFSVDEVGAPDLDRLWLRGGFPRAFLARSDPASTRWLRSFAKTFLERDLPQLGVGIPAATLGRFWAMLAHYHGQIWNAAELARSFAVSDHAVRRYLDTLAATYVVRLLQPWHENLGKRQVKSPKVLLPDTGLLHSLLGITSQEDLLRHPKLGASWEGLCVETVIARLGAYTEECFFWATQAGAELDLLIVRGRQRRGFEMKRTVAPSVTPSMRSALQDLHLDSLDVVYAGERTYPMAKRIRAVPLARVFDDVAPFR
jgi:uncharacterized protein